MCWLLEAYKVTVRSPVISQILHCAVGEFSLYCIREDQDFLSSVLLQTFFTCPRLNGIQKNERKKLSQWTGETVVHSSGSEQIFEMLEFFL